LTKNHVEFQRHKMKVCYAAQVFSLSVAAALFDLLSDENFPNFHDADATIYLLKMVGYKRENNF